MEIKIICLNLWNGGNLFDGIIDFLQQEDADIICLQEVYNASDAQLPKRYRSIETLQEMFHFPAYDFAPAMNDKLKEGEVISGTPVFP